MVETGMNSDQMIRQLALGADRKGCELEVSRCS